MKMKKKDLDLYKKKLLEEKERLLIDLQDLDKSALHETTQEGSGDLSAYGSHLADVATDTYEQEKSLNFMSNEEYLLQEIEDALSKIEDKSYGKCETCNVDVPQKRLDAEPYARLCMDCKRKEEEDNNSGRKSVLGNSKKARRGRRS